MITSLTKKNGGQCRLDKDSHAFKQFIEDSILIDIPTSNDLHTWNKKRGRVHQIASCLDRFLISEHRYLADRV